MAAEAGAEAGALEGAAEGERASGDAAEEFEKVLRIAVLRSRVPPIP